MMRVSFTRVVAYQRTGPLIEWVRGQGMDFDRWDTEQVDNFRGRCETCLTDPAVEPRKARWKIEVAIKLAED